MKEKGNIFLNRKYFLIPKCILYSFFCCCCRNDGIIIAITVWQVFAETLFNLASIIAYEVISIKNYDFVNVLVQFFVSYIILPSFYFLADNKFRIALKEMGILRSIWAALKQKYE